MSDEAVGIPFAGTIGNSTKRVARPFAPPWRNNVAPSGTGRAQGEYREPGYPACPLVHVYHGVSGVCGHSRGGVSY